MITLPPLNIDGLFTSHDTTTTATKTWYGHQSGLLGPDGKWIDVITWVDRKVHGHYGDTPEYACEVTASGFFLGSPRDVREDIANRLDSHLEANR